MGFSTIEIIPGVFQQREDNFQRRLDLVHVNFGIDGRCDGYYLPGVFDLSEDVFDGFYEENDRNTNLPYVFDLNVKYLIYDLQNVL